MAHGFDVAEADHYGFDVAVAVAGEGDSVDILSHTHIA